MIFNIIAALPEHRNLLVETGHYRNRYEVLVALVESGGNFADYTQAGDIMSTHSHYSFHTLKWRDPRPDPNSVLVLCPSSPFLYSA